MVIWLNGAFGAGKTQTAYELHRRLPDSFVYDPENAGYFMRANLPEVCKGIDFQDYPMWRSVNYEMLRYICQSYAGVVIVPMTLTNRTYYDEIIGALLRDGVDVRHFILFASPQTLRQRLRKRLERKNCWAEQQIARCIRAFETDITQTKIETDEKDIYAVVEEVARLCGLTLSPDTRSRVRKAVDRLVMQIRHIR